MILLVFFLCVLAYFAHTRNMLRLCVQNCGNDSEIYTKRLLLKAATPYHTDADTRQLLANVLKDDHYFYINL